MSSKKDRRRVFRDKRERNVGISVAILFPLVMIQILWVLVASLSGFQIAGVLTLLVALATYFFQRTSEQHGSAQDALTHFAMLYLQFVRKIAGLTEEEVVEKPTPNRTPDEIIEAHEKRLRKITSGIRRLEEVALTKVNTRLKEDISVRDEVYLELKTEMEKQEKANPSVLKSLKRRLQPRVESIRGFEEKKEEIENMLLLLKHLETHTEVSLEGLKVTASGLKTTGEVQDVIQDIVGELSLDPDLDTLGENQSLMATEDMAFQQFKADAAKIEALIGIQEKVIVGFGNAENPMSYDDPSLIAMLMDSGLEIPDIARGEGKKAISIDKSSRGVIEIPLPDDVDEQKTQNKGRNRQGGSKYLKHLD